MQPVFIHKPRNKNVMKVLNIYICALCTLADVHLMLQLRRKKIKNCFNKNKFDKKMTDCLQTLVYKPGQQFACQSSFMRNAEVIPFSTATLSRSCLA